MRYIYIICLLLSSFFTQKSSLATETTQRSAFFVPQNAFQENVTVKDINDMKPRYEKKEPPKETLSQNSGLVTPAKKPKISLPYVRKPLVLVDDTKEKAPQKVSAEENKNIASKPLEAPTPQKIDDKIKEKLSKYTLGNDFGEKNKKTVDLSTHEILETELSKKLSAIPFADRTLPKFKQCYEEYGSDLRILFHRGRFPTNQKQETTLAKANSPRRFQVE